MIIQVTGNRVNLVLLHKTHMKSIQHIKHRTIFAICCIAIVMLLIAGWVLSKAIPSTEATRLRNALLADVGLKADFNWAPSDIPPSYRQENMSQNSEVSLRISKQIGKISGKTQLEKGVAIARVLLSNDSPKGRGILSNTNEALDLIINQGTGYCGDYTQVFNAAAYLHNIPVREWGLSFDQFGGYGHAVSEIYDSAINKWVFLDTFNGFYLVDKEILMPLSVMEFQNLLQTESVENIKKRVQIIRIKPSRFGFLNDNKLLEYFSRGKNHFYLWWGNDALSYDNNPIVSLTSRLSRSAEQLVAIALGVHQRIRLLPNPANVDDIARLMTLKNYLIIAFLLEIILGVFLIAVSVRVFVSRKQQPMSYPQC